MFVSVSVWLTPCPCSRLQYSLDVADRLADEHVLIGVYVNMLQSSPARLVQVWHLWGTQQRDLAQPSALPVPFLPDELEQLLMCTSLEWMCMNMGYVLPKLVDCGTSCYSLYWRLQGIARNCLVKNGYADCLGYWALGSAGLGGSAEIFTQQ